MIWKISSKFSLDNFFISHIVVQYSGYPLQPAKKDAKETAHFKRVLVITETVNIVVNPGPEVLRVKSSLTLQHHKRNT